MRIEAIEVLRVAIPFDAHRQAPEREEVTFNAASTSLKRMETLLVKVITDTGLVGWGEGFGHLSNPVTEQALRSLVGPFFVGQTLPENREALETLMQQAEFALHAFGRSGPVRFALSAVDIALWDLLGQQQQKPLWQLLGGARQRIRRYASLVGYDNQPEEVARQVRRASAAGFDTLKLHETEFDAIAAARAALPADATLMVDVNCPWSVEEAERRAEPLRALNLGWLEEPIWPPDDYVGLARLRKSGVPLAAGENVDGDRGFMQIIRDRVVDVIQPSVAKVGGISAALNVFEMARRHDVRVVPHCFYYGAGMLATAHLVATLPSDVLLEVPFIQFESALYPDWPAGSELELPGAPGLGFQPSTEVIDRYRLTGWRLDAEGVHDHV